MLKKKITYTDFDGEEVTEELYFNVSKTELIELEVHHQEGFADFIQGVIKAQDKKTLIDEFQRLLLLSYGQKSPDGRRFIKSDQLREEFAQTAAYDALFIELATDENSAAEFIIGILPKDMAQSIAETTAEDTKAVVPVPPLPPRPQVSSTEQG